MREETKVLAIEAELKELIASLPHLPPEEKAKVLKDLPAREPMAKEALALAKADPKDPAAFDALLMAAQMGMPGSPEAAEARTIMVRDHVENPRLGMVVDSLAMAGAEGRGTCQAIVENPKVSRETSGHPSPVRSGVVGAVVTASLCRTASTGHDGRLRINDACPARHDGQIL